MISFETLPEYEKDLKALTKRFRTLPDDINVVRKVLDVSPNANPTFSYRIEGLGLETCVIKVKKIACKALKGKGLQSGP